MIFFPGMGRRPKEIYGLSNCTWYRERSCCTWTEVMSVFQNMLPLQTSSEKCRNHMNYLMCYFCSPDQYIWYKDKVKVCKSFCDALYSHCKDAKYKDVQIGDKYSNGRAFCEAQHFGVVDDNKKCFEFDNTPFDSESTRLIAQLRITLAILFTWLLFYLQQT